LLIFLFILSASSSELEIRFLGLL